MSNIRILKKLDGSVVGQTKFAYGEVWKDDLSIPIVMEKKSLGEVLREFYATTDNGSKADEWEDIAQSFCSYLKSKGWREPNT